MKQHIPNFLTLMNLLTGSVAMVLVLKGNILAGSWLIGLACVFDFADGLAARLLRVKSELGKQLDSLADMVSFGLVPGTILYVLITDSLLPVNDNLLFAKWVPFAGFSITLFSALRLARFNLDDRQQEVFIGLPTPANAVLIASFPFILQEDQLALAFLSGLLKQGLTHPLPLLLMTGLLSWLLISPIRLISLKFKTFAWKQNRTVYLLILVSLFLIQLLKFEAVPLILLIYILFSVLLLTDETSGRSNL